MGCCPSQLQVTCKRLQEDPGGLDRCPWSLGTEELALDSCLALSPHASRVKLARSENDRLAGMSVSCSPDTSPLERLAPRDVLKRDPGKRSSQQMGE